MQNNKTTQSLRKRAARMDVGKSLYLNEPYNTSRHATFSTTLRRMASNMGKDVKFSVHKTRTNKYCITRIS